MHVSWDSFKVYNSDVRGLRYKFEDLCRQLFANENISDNSQRRYLHANPNNPGLECEPIFDEKNRRWIGFQAKFFDTNVDYAQIKRSAVKIVEYYKGKVDFVFLFCNYPLTSTSLTDTVDLLHKANIELELVTDNAILDLVRRKYPYLGAYYFGNHPLQLDWFKKHSSFMFDNLGYRFNQDFNVETECYTEISLFLRDKNAVIFLNGKKQKLLSEIQSVYYNNDQHRAYLDSLKRIIESLPDVEIDSLYESFNWHDSVLSTVKLYLEELESERNDLNKEKAQISDNLLNPSLSEEDKRKERKKFVDLSFRINTIQSLLILPDIIKVSVREQKLLQNQILKLYGNAGTGKSQLLAYKTNSLLSDQRTVLLLLAGIYFSEEPILKQIMDNLQLDFSFEELIDVLETIGERDNCVVPIFIDALNETWHSKLWKIGLPLIVDKVKKAPMVKLVFSYRHEYAEIILPDSIKNEKANNNIVSIKNNGFENNSSVAVKDFLNHFHIPFTFNEFFCYELSNPLFLTLYCKTYNGEDVSIPKLYEGLIKNVEKRLFDIPRVKELGYCEKNDILEPLIEQISEKMLSNERRWILKSELSKLSYWSEYGFTCPAFVWQLEREGLIHDYKQKGNQYYFFAYDQMNDYFCAKAIFYLYSNKNDIRLYLKNKVLKINDKSRVYYGNIDLFVYACALYAEKYGEECIDLIDELNEAGKYECFTRYVKSYQWRDKNYIKGKLLLSLLNIYPCELDILWSMLIGNSTKVNHPLNADFLHDLLFGYTITKRDYIWTIYVNALTNNKDNRVVQLVEMYNRGEKLEGMTESQLGLLLTLFAWFLTSSNRWLRDYTSKAMIEILKEHFHLCIPILKKFKDVDDPYIIQRLYGVVFGACCKRINGDLKSVAEYVFESVFNQEKVYPDVLLRDYARLIIEKFIWENPQYRGIIDRQKIIPPYKSDPIPKLDDNYYDRENYDGATLRLINSMYIDNKVFYGDFGRYVFQSALKSFDVDINHMFNYAIFHILNVIGFSEDLFREHDLNCGLYYRNETAKIERIGKKYQWITFYNIMARVSDHCKYIDTWNNPEDENISFEGAWDPYVRDFDPTLNRSFMICNKAPVFNKLSGHKILGINENTKADITNSSAKKVWLENKGNYFKKIKDTLVLTDASGEKWIVLTAYCDTGDIEPSQQNLHVWSWLYAYFASPDQVDILSCSFNKGLSVINIETASFHETYTVFNREYPWSPSCRDLEQYVYPKIKTGQFECVSETVPVTFFSKYSSSIKQEVTKFVCEFNNEQDEFSNNIFSVNVNKDDAGLENSFLQFKETTVKRKIEIEIRLGKFLHATTNLLWEEEYDVSKGDHSISYSLPCAQLIETMKLNQLKEDGFFYDEDGKLAAFDTRLTQKINSVVVRKDILDSFVHKTGYYLVWLVDAEKEIHGDKQTIAAWSDWEGVYVYNGKDVLGDMKLFGVNQNE